MSPVEVAIVPWVEQGAALQSPFSPARLGSWWQSRGLLPPPAQEPLGEAGAHWLAGVWPAPGMLWPHSQNPALGVCLLLRPRGLVLL